jgi:hypothetical protein
MALDNYSDLQASALDWMERAGQSGKAPDWIKLAEAKLNRKLGAVEVEATLSSVAASRLIDISSLSMVEPIALFIAPPSEDEREIQPQANGTYPLAEITESQPRIYSIVGSDIQFDRIVDQVYPFRFIYRERFALSDAVPTNWLLTNHPDVYLAATLMWGAGYNQDWQNGPVWKSMLDEAIPEIQHTISKNKRGMLRVDRAITMVNRRWFYGNTDWIL